MVTGYEQHYYRHVEIIAGEARKQTDALVRIADALEKLAEPLEPVYRVGPEATPVYLETLVDTAMAAAEGTNDAGAGGPDVPGMGGDHHG